MSIYYRTNEFGEELCPTCGKKLFNITICTYPPTPRYECYNCGYVADGDKVIDSGNSVEAVKSVTPHDYCTRFETSVTEKELYNAVWNVIRNISHHGLTFWHLLLRKF